MSIITTLLELPPTQNKLLSARIKRIGHTTLHNPAVDYFRYTDGRLWAPDKDIDMPGMRHVVRTLGDSARTLAGNSRQTPRPGTMLEKLSIGVDRAMVRNAHDKLASALHRQWQQDWEADPRGGILPDGTRVARPKETTDQKWIAAHGTSLVDIANTSYPQLPEDRQLENSDAAYVVLRIFADRGMDINLRSPTVRSSIGQAVHGPWLDRNPSGYEDKDMRGSFDSMPPHLQRLDIRQVEIGLRLFGQGHDGLQGALARTFNPALN